MSSWSRPTGSRCCWPRTFVTRRPTERAGAWASSSRISMRSRATRLSGPFAPTAACWGHRRRAANPEERMAEAKLIAPFSAGGATEIDAALARRLLELALAQGGDYADLYFE